MVDQQLDAWLVAVVRCEVQWRLVGAVDDIHIGLPSE